MTFKITGIIYLNEKLTCVRSVSTFTKKGAHNRANYNKWENVIIVIM